MAKKDTAKPGTAKGERRTFALSVPIGDDKGNIWHEITVVEPELHHQAKAQRKKTAVSTEILLLQLAELCDVSEAVLRRLKARDARRIKDWLDQVTGSGVASDVIAEAAGLDPMPLEAAIAVVQAARAGGSDAGDAIARAEAVIKAAPRDAIRAAGAFVPPLEPTRSFRLLVPVEKSDGALSEITVREPDLEAAIAVERAMETPAQATAAMIASLSGQTIPVVMRMKLRDVARIERWLDFFSDAGATSRIEAAPAAAANGAAGATSQ